MLIHSWIMNSVNDSIAQSIVFMENALDVWNDLKERFAQGDLVCVSEIQQEIYALHQGSRSVTEFYSVLKVLWEELEIYMPIPSCTCRNRCSCDVMRVARNNHHMLHAMRFLTGLNDVFAVVRSQILLIDPLPPMNKIFSMVLQHERQCGLSISVSEDSKALINATDSKSNGSRSGKNLMPPSGAKRYCTFCHCSNHVVENCFKKHGLPPHLQRGTTSGSAHHAASEGSDYDDDSASASHESRSQGPVITQDQFDKLMSLLQTSSINQGASSAASNQVSSSKATGPSSVSQQGTSYTFSTYSLFCHNVNLGSWIIDS
jgi:hypothetical protein